MLIGGKEYKTGQRIKVINAKSILHYKYGMTRDCNKDMTGITGVITAESTYDEYARANLRVDEPYSEHYRNGMTRHIRLCITLKSKEAFNWVLETVTAWTSITKRMFKFKFAFKSDNL